MTPSGEEVSILRTNMLVCIYLNYHNAKLHMGLWLRLVGWKYYFLVSILVFHDLCLTRMYFHNNEICRFRPEYVDKRPMLILSIRLALQSISTPPCKPEAQLRPCVPCLGTPSPLKCSPDSSGSNRCSLCILWLHSVYFKLLSVSQPTRLPTGHSHVSFHDLEEP